MKFKKTLFVIVACCQSLTQVNALSMINKVIHQQGTTNAILGKVSFYFAGKPVVAVPSIDKDARGMVQAVFFIPSAAIDQAARSEMQQLKQDMPYAIRLEQNGQGVKIIVSYDARRVTLKTYPHQSTSKKHGFSLIFADTAALKAINEHQGNLLRIS